MFTRKSVSTNTKLGKSTSPFILKQTLNKKKKCK